MKRPTRKSLPRRAKRARFASDTSALYFDVLPVDVVSVIVSFIVGPPRELSRPKCKLPPKEKAAPSPIAHKGQRVQPGAVPAPQPPAPAPPVVVHALHSPPAHMRIVRTGGRPGQALDNMVEFLSTRNDSLKLACAMNFSSVVETESYSMFSSSQLSAATDVGEVRLSTSGTKQYKNLNTVCKTLGSSVVALKFQDKHITKRYSQIARRYCPNLRVLKLSWGCMFASWRISFRKMGTQLEEMLAGVTPLDRLEVEITECSQFHIDALGKFASTIKHIVLKLNTDIGRNALGIESLMPVYAAVSEDEGSILKNFEIHVPKKFHDAEALKLQSIPILCPKVEVTVNGTIVDETDD